ncbi:MAG: YbaK/EbsC family protein [Bacteroidota bacterium]|nr:YbaK/EbsC family protein [Bacteroidota bacterium]
MILAQLKEYLDANGVKYMLITHSRAYTAQEIADTAHIPGREVAKTVMVVIDGVMTMIVIPGCDMVDFRLLKRALSCGEARLATEEEFARLFPGCETGAMPPFGNLYNLPVIASERLAQDEYIAFNAGTHRDLVRMAYADFERLVAPRVVDISVPRRSHADSTGKYEPTE